MSAILNSLNAHNLLIFQLILMIFVSEFMVYRALSDKAYLLLELLSSLTSIIIIVAEKLYCPVSIYKLCGCLQQYIKGKGMSVSTCILCIWGKRCEGYFIIDFWK